MSGYAGVRERPAPQPENEHGMILERSDSACQRAGCSQTWELIHALADHRGLLEDGLVRHSLFALCFQPYFVIRRSSSGEDNTEMNDSTQN